jgi:hypothetical protein
MPKRIFFASGDNVQNRLPVPVPVPEVGRPPLSHMEGEIRQVDRVTQSEFTVAPEAATTAGTAMQHCSSQPPQPFGSRKTNAALLAGAGCCALERGAPSHRRPGCACFTGRRSENNFWRGLISPIVKVSARVFYPSTDHG